MRSSRIKVTWLLAAAVAIVAIAAIACEEAKEAAPAAPAAAAAPAPAALPAPASAPVGAPAPGVAPAPSAPAARAAPAPAAAGPAPPVPAPLIAVPVPVRTGPQARPAMMGPSSCYIVGDQVSVCPERSPHAWQSAGQIPQDYFAYYDYSGPKPTKFYQSPMSYQLVLAGQLPPVEDRLPALKDIDIIQAPDGIGEYGGTYRTMRSGNNFPGGTVMEPNWYDRDSNGIDWRPSVGKSFEHADGGRTYIMTVRKGLKWSDGTPFTMENIRFAWEDLNFNTELNSGGVGRDYIDPVTKNPVTFKVIDDDTWSLTYDTPVYNLFELRGGRGGECGRTCFWSTEWVKQFHPKYADPQELQKMISDGDYDTWTQLIKNKLGTFRGGPDKPCLAAWCVSSASDQLLALSRNHYYGKVDPEGNQLPYVDSVASFMMESREVVVFRAMAGEMDGRTSPFSLSEVPLYMANMEKGDYSIYGWLEPSGCDFCLGIGQTYNEDPEIGKWIRTKKFRQALSLGMDRSEFNEGVFMGRATAQQWVPHPNIVFYPGDEYKTLNIEHDPVMANQILDSIGLDKKDAQGFRLRTDGSGDRLTLELGVHTWNPSYIPITEYLVDQWAKIGIELGWTLTPQSDGMVIRGEGYFQWTSGIYSANPWTVGWGTNVPNSPGALAPEIGRWYSTDGAAGQSPNASKEGWLPLSPEGTFPADVSGNLTRMAELWFEGKRYATYSPERIELGKELYRLHPEELYMIGTVTFAGSGRDIFLNRNNMRNKPYLNGLEHTSFVPQAFFFEDGIDNMNHSGNRSKRYQSESFFDFD